MGFFEKWFPMEGLEDPKLPEQNDEQKLVVLLKKWSDALPVEGGHQGEIREGVENRLQGEGKPDIGSWLEEIYELSVNLEPGKLAELYSKAGLSSYETDILVQDKLSRQSQPMS